MGGVRGQWAVGVHPRDERPNTRPLAQKLVSQPGDSAVCLCWLLFRCVGVGMSVCATARVCVCWPYTQKSDELIKNL